MECYRINSLNFSSFDTSLVTDMGEMFRGCHSLESVPLLDMSKNRTMYYFMHDCYAIDGLPLFNTAIVTNFDHAFSNCTSLTESPAFDTSSGKNMAYMFNNCTSLVTIPAAFFDVSNVTTAEDMFFSCEKLTTPIPPTSWPKCTSFSETFCGCKKIPSIGAMDTPVATTFNSTFTDTKALTSSPLRNTSAVTTFSTCFTGSGITSFTAIDMSAAKSVYRMFYGASNLTELPYMNTSSCKNFNWFLAGMSSLVNIEGIDMSSAGEYTMDNREGNTMLYDTDYPTGTSTTTIGSLDGLMQNIKLNDYVNLTKASLQGILNSLGDVSGSGGKTIKIGSANKAKLDAADIAAAEAKGWTIL